MINEKEIVGTVDCTPSWEGILPYMLEVYYNTRKRSESHFLSSQEDNESLKNIRHEFNRMAKIADKYIEYTKQPK